MSRRYPRKPHTKLSYLNFFANKIRLIVRFYLIYDMCVWSGQIMFISSMWSRTTLIIFKTCLQVVDTLIEHDFKIIMSVSTVSSYKHTKWKTV